MIGKLLSPLTMLSIVKNSIQDQVKEPLTAYNIIYNNNLGRLKFIIFVEGKQEPIIADYENDSIVIGIKGLIRTKIGKTNDLDAFKIEYEHDLPKAFVTVYHKDKNGNKKIDRHEL